MKMMLSGLVTVTTLMTSAMAAPVCKNTAVRVAKQNARDTTLVSSVGILPSKPYLESYRIALTDSENEKSEVIDVTLMKSDCSIVSVIPRL